MSARIPDTITVLAVTFSPFVAGIFLLKLLSRIRKEICQERASHSADAIDKARKRFLEMRCRGASQTLSVIKLEGSEQFEHQVAGHINEVLRRYKDMVLKPMIKHKLFIREVSFYEDCASCGRSSSRFPHAFLPRYFGVVMCENRCGKLIPYIALEDATRRFRTPCVIDIKMGRQTFEPTASLEKMIREKIKYKHQETVGFRLTGFKVFDAVQGEYIEVRKKFGRSLSPDMIKHGLAAFFCNGSGFRTDVILDVLQQLEALLQWTETQRSWKFYSSSILIVYEAERLYPLISNLEHTHHPSSHFLVRCRESNDSPVPISLPARTYACRNSTAAVRVIDHAHTLPSNSGDDSYSFALRSLIKHLDELLADIKAGQYTAIHPGLSPALKVGMI
mmetsp:Transcript_5173/g.7929  ORF Transcript_5173/g.7929 Transcript_5173/m.7929 type:complete len:391 (-) Transcript_5173:201-1373(-)